MCYLYKILNILVICFKNSLFSVVYPVFYLVLKSFDFAEEGIARSARHIFCDILIDSRYRDQLGE